MNTHQWIEYAVTQTAGAFKEKYEPLVSDFLATIRNLADQKRVLKDEVKQLRNKLASSKASSATTTKSVQAKSGFRPSSELQSAMLKASALQKSLDRTYREEEAQWEKALINNLKIKATKLADLLAYKQAINSGSYSAAIKAIKERESYIATNGVEFTVGYSGFSSKGIWDQENRQLETFTVLNSTDEVTISGSSFAVTKADICQVNGSNNYQLWPIR